MPGMLYARVLRPSAHGANLRSIDTSGAESMEGVTVVRDGDLIAVLHSSPDRAENGLARIKAQYDLPEAGLDGKTIFVHLLKVAPPGEVLTQGGDLKEGEKQASEIFEKTYLQQYVAHAIFDATGDRLFEMPMTPDRIKSATEKSRK